MARFIEVGDDAVLDLYSEKRLMLTKELAEELLTSAKAACGDLSGVRKIRLGTKSFSREAAVVGAAVIAELSALKSADLADIIAGRPEEEALDVLLTTCSALPSDKILDLDLSDNALGEKGVRTLEPVFSALCNLESLAFMNNGLSALSIELLAKCLCPARLKRLHFDNNMSGDGGAVAIAEFLSRCPVIEDFRMSSSRVRMEGGLALARALKSDTLGSTLRRLDLSDSMLGEDGGVALSEAFSHSGMPVLVFLSLRDTGLEEEGLEPVIEALKGSDCCALLEELDLSCLEITPELTPAVVEPVFAFVRSFLSTNFGITLSLAHILRRILRSKTNLRVLRLEENELASDGACTLAACIASAGKLRTIDVRSNQIGANGALALGRALASRLSESGSWRLELDSNQIGLGALEKLRAMLVVGGDEVLGSMEENEPDMDEDECEDDDGLAKNEGCASDADDLADALGGMSLKA